MEAPSVEFLADLSLALLPDLSPVLDCPAVDSLVPPGCPAEVSPVLDSLADFTLDPVSLADFTLAHLCPVALMEVPTAVDPTAVDPALPPPLDLPLPVC
jgi:hypothetical protein